METWVKDVLLKYLDWFPWNHSLSRHSRKMNISHTWSQHRCSIPNRLVFGKPDRTWSPVKKCLSLLILRHISKHQQTQQDWKQCNSHYNGFINLLCCQIVTLLAKSCWFSLPFITFVFNAKFKYFQSYHLTHLNYMSFLFLTVVLISNKAVACYSLYQSIPYFVSAFD